MKKIISLIMVVVISFLSIVIFGEYSTDAAEEVKKEFFGIRDVNYFLYNGEPWLENLIFEKDESLTLLTSDNPERVFFSEIPDKSNDFFASHKAVYCLEANAAYPWGCTYVSDTYWAESTYSDEEISAISNILRNGYPSMRDYWKAEGINSYGAQMMATQAAIWIVTGEFNTTLNQLSYDIDALSPNYSEYSYEEIGNLKAMVEELVECGHNTSICLYEPYINVCATPCYFYEGDMIYTFEINSNVHSSPILAIKDFDSTMKVFVDDLELDYSVPCNIPVGSHIVRIHASGMAYENTSLEISLSAVEYTADIDEIYWYVSDEQVEKWAGSGLHTRQQLADTNISPRLISDSAVSIGAVMPISNVVMTIFKNDEGSGLKGAVFELVNLEDIYVGNGIVVPAGTILDRKCSDDNGNILFRNDLPAGYVYEAREVVFPTGYVACNPVAITFDATNSPYNDIEILEYVSNTPQYGRLSLEKNGEVLVNVTYDEEGNFKDFVYETRRVKGALYGIYSEASCEEEYLLEKIMTEDECVYSKEYKILDYPILYVKELSAPMGLVLDSTVHEIELLPDITKEVAVTLVSLSDIRQKVKLGIKKYDSDSALPVADAYFTLKNDSDIMGYDGEVLLAKGSSIECVKTDDSGSAYFSFNLPVGFYSAYETMVPSGYKDDGICVGFDTTYDAALPEIIIEKEINNTPVIGAFALNFSRDLNMLGIGMTSPVKHKSSNVPATSDNSNIAFYAILSIFSLLILCFLKHKKLVSFCVLAFLFLLIPNKTFALEYDVESPVIYDGKNYEMEDKITCENTTYYLKEVEKIPQNISNTVHVKENYIYEDYPSALEIPDTVITLATDSLTNQTKETILYKTSVEESLSWVEDFTFVITCYNTDGLYYLHEGVKYEFHEPDDFLKISDLLLRELGLSGEEYVIEGFDYAGEEYMSNGRVSRDINAYGRRISKTFNVCYEGDALFDYSEACIYVGHYETENDSFVLTTEIPSHKESEVMVDEDVVDVDAVNLQTFKTKEFTDFSMLIYPLVVIILLLLIILMQKKKKA